MIFGMIMENQNMVKKPNGDIYKDIAEDVETRLDTSNYELDRPLPNREKSNWINKR